jgi:hypothetical protein
MEHSQAEEHVHFLAHCAFADLGEQKRCPYASDFAAPQQSYPVEDLRFSHSFNPKMDRPVAILPIYYNKIKWLCEGWLLCVFLGHGKSLLQLDAPS